MDLPEVQEPVRVDSEAMIRSALEDGVLVLRLARPERRNALDESMVEGLRASLEAAASDDATRAVILTGEGAAFCAGADLARFDRKLDGRAFRFESHRLTTLTDLIERVEKPMIAAVNGAAVGFGVQLALSCDLRVGAASARFLFSEGRLGLLPTHGGVARLVKLVGLARARDVLLSSREIDTTRAYELGLLTEVAPDEELLERARALAEDALRRAPLSYGLTKRLLLLAASADLPSGLIAETIAQSVLVASEDHAEGVEAAREGRPPSFTGR
jgi:enoyl-CoA hydratase/carnithine racemase